MLGLRRTCFASQPHIFMFPRVGGRQDVALRRTTHHTFPEPLGAPATVSNAGVRLLKFHKD